MTEIQVRAGDERRAAMPGLTSPFPLRNQVPAMLMDDPFVCGLLDGLDQVIAPVISVLDCYDAYLDPRLAPADFTRYLGSWLLASLDDPWDEAAVRRDVADAYERACSAGTTAGLYRRLIPHLVKSVSIRDTGSTTASETPSDPAEWGDAPPPVVRVVIVPHEDRPADLGQIERIVRDALPAHVSLDLSSA